MFARINRPLFVMSALVLTAGVAGAQGYAVRSWGYYDPVPYGPVVGGTYGYSPYRPTVTVHDPWRGPVDMPLQPKVLYYNAPFLTAQGGYRPTSITVMPNSRPPAYTVPALPAQPAPAVAQPAPPAASQPAPPVALPSFKYDGGPTSPVPDVADPPAAKPVPPRVVPDQPPPKPIPPTIPAPRPAAKVTVPDRPGADPTFVPPPAAKATVPDRPAAGPAIPDLPPIPKVPALPDTPKAPGSDASPAVPKLGPTPMDVPPAPRPGG